MVLCHTGKAIQGIDSSLGHLRVEVCTATSKPSFYSCLCVPIQWWSNRINPKLSISFNRVWIRFLCVVFIDRLDSKDKEKEILGFCLQQVNKCQHAKPLWKHRHDRSHCLESILCPLGHSEFYPSAVQSLNCQHEVSRKSFGETKLCYVPSDPGCYCSFFGGQKFCKLL